MSECINFAPKLLNLRQIQLHFLKFSKRNDKMKQLSVMLLSLFLAVNIAHSIPPSKVERSKKGGVALVLSGGGAKGLYHVGVIKALEENDIAIDYVSGASMGAIISSLYASGWSPQRMWDFFVTDSVSTWLAGRIPDEYSGYYSRFEPTSEMVSINIMRDTTKNRSHLQLPVNLISPYLLDIAFSKLLSAPSAAARDDFDRLFVPFRCVATDTYKGEIVTFNNGNLPFAVRASMTIPLVFKPLVRDSTLLYDGGVINNFPWQVLDQEFSPSNIIGGICTDNVVRPSQDDIVNQIMTLTMRPTNYELRDTIRDINIKRIMPDFGILDYQYADTIMTLGYEDTMAQIEEIKRRVTKRRSKEEVERRRSEFIASTPELTFDEVVINGLTKEQESFVRRQLELNKVDKFTYDFFYERYMRMLSSGVFTSDFPVVEYNEETGYFSIHLEMTTKATMRVSLGGNISSTSLNQGFVALNYRHTDFMASNYSFWGHFGMFYSAAKLGGMHSIYNQFPLFVNYNFRYEGMDFNNDNMKQYYINKAWRLINQENTALNLTLSTPVLSNSALRLDLLGVSSIFRYYSTPYTSVDSPTITKFSYFSITQSLETNTINYPLYPNSGISEKLALRYTVGTEQLEPGTLSTLPPQNNINRWWFELKYRREQYLPLSSIFTLGYLLDVTISNQPKFSTEIATEAISPRFSPTPQMESMFMSEFASRSYIAGGITPIFNILSDNKLYVKTYLYAFVPQEIVFEDDRFIPITSQRLTELVDFAFGASLVYQTPIGPASLTYAQYTTGTKNWGVQFNFGYTLFKNIR